MIDRWLANDWVLRVLSLLLALGIWWQVTVTQNPTVKHTVSQLPVTVQSSPKHLRLEITPKDASVVVRGPVQTVTTLQPGAIRVYVSVPYDKPGRYKTALHAEIQAGGTQVVSVMPATATVTLRSP